MPRAGLSRDAVVALAVELLDADPHAPVTLAAVAGRAGVAVPSLYKHVRSLAGIQCLCTTMYRIDLKHLYWTLENLVEGRVVNPVVVDPDTRHWSRIALDRMLALRPARPVSAK